MSVYTKTGDKGKTKLYDGREVFKSSVLINTIGIIDEFNSYLGIVGGLVDIQKNLFTINSIISGANLKFNKDEVLKLEKEIDKMESILPVQTQFLIYGGTKKARLLYYSRSLCRRAERSFVDLKKIKQKDIILQYLNRLSDYLFILARFVNFKKKVKEASWK